MFSNKLTPLRSGRESSRRGGDAERGPPEQALCQAVTPSGHVTRTRVSQDSADPLCFTGEKTEVPEAAEARAVRLPRTLRRTRFVSPSSSKPGQCLPATTWTANPRGRGPACRAACAPARERPRRGLSSARFWARLCKMVSVMPNVKSFQETSWETQFHFPGPYT